MITKPASTFTALQQPLVDTKTGYPTYTWMKKFQEWEQKLYAALSIIGNFTGVIDQSATISNRTGTVGSTVQRLQADGNFESTDYINDGTGSPLEGGAVAFQALRASAPAAGKSLVFDGVVWNPEQVAYSNITGAPVPPANAPVIGSEWIDSYDATTGAFHQSRPAFGDVSGNLAATQLPVGGLTGSVTLAALTGTGTQGSLTFINGQIIAKVDPT